MPPKALYVRSDRTGTAADPDQIPPSLSDAALVTDLREVTWSTSTEVATAASGPFVAVGDALDNDARVREALLALSPDEGVERWKKLRAIALAAPVSWTMFVLNDYGQVRDVAKDAHRLTSSEAFRQAELDPDTREMALARHAKIDKAIAMRWTYVGIEGAIGIAALVVVLGAMRRFRAIAVAVGAGAALWWLFHAGQPDRCFGAKAYREILLAAMGLVGAIATYALAPSETSIAKRLRERIGLSDPEAPRSLAVAGIPTSNRDILLLLGAVWAGIMLPFLLRWLAAAGVRDLPRTAFFIGFCLLAFIGFLGLRRDDTKVKPRWAMLVLAAFLGFGVTTACDVAARASLATVVEAKTCLSPNTENKLKNVQEKGAKETAAARKETQTQVLAFWIAVLAAPLAEEMLYRGAIQRVARRRVGARWAMIISAAVFGFAHALAFPTAFYQHFGLGLAFAAVFELAGGGAVAILASAATHAMWNLWLASMPVF